LIANAMSAAPSAVAKEAAIVVPGENGQMRTLREGTNGFTCMPDDPGTPGNDPMCLDQNGMEWAKAWMSHTDPPAGKVGFGDTQRPYVMWAGTPYAHLMIPVR
jgi:hypothetical protein